MWSVVCAEAAECMSSAESVWPVGVSVVLLGTFVAAEHDIYGCLVRSYVEFNCSFLRMSQWC